MSNPVNKPQPVISNPVNKPVISNPVNKPVISNPVNKPQLSLINPVQHITINKNIQKTSIKHTIPRAKVSLEEYNAHKPDKPEEEVVKRPVVKMPIVLGKQRRITFTI